MLVLMPLYHTRANQTKFTVIYSQKHVFKSGTNVSTISESSPGSPDGISRDPKFSFKPQKCNIFRHNFGARVSHVRLLIVFVEFHVPYSYLIKHF